MLTLREILTRSTAYLKRHGIQSARLDSELLLGKALSLDRISFTCSWIGLSRRRNLLLPGSSSSCGPKKAACCLPPGEKGVFGLDFFVNEKVLIPRPETELLVERVLELAPGARRAVEVGVGSGAIAVSLAKELPQLEIWATDISEGALAVARKNCEIHGVSERVHLFAGDLFSPLQEMAGTFEVVVSNPPYIPQKRA